VPESGAFAQWAAQFCQLPHACIAAPLSPALGRDIHDTLSGVFRFHCCSCHLREFLSLIEPNIPRAFQVACPAV